MKSIVWIMTGIYLFVGALFMCVFPTTHIIVGDNLAPRYRRGDVVTISNDLSHLDSGDVVICMLNGWSLESHTRQIKSVNNKNMVLVGLAVDSNDTWIERKNIKYRVESTLFTTRIFLPLAILYEYRYWILPLLAAVS